MTRISDETLLDLAENNKTQIIETLKILIFRKDEKLFELINDYHEDMFFDPLVFSFLNVEDNSNKKQLRELFFGYSSLNKFELEYSFNNNGIAYIPNLGYYKKNLSNKTKEYDKTGPNEKSCFVDKLEIQKHIHPLLTRYFVEFYKGHILDHNPTFTSTWKDFIKPFRSAVNIIKEYLPIFYKELILANKRVFFHDNVNIINFTTIETLGMLYFNTLKENNEIYFIEELIHQGSHNFLNILLFNQEEYFKIDVKNTMLRESGGEDWDYRTIHSAFHGLYTVYRRVTCFDILLKANIFSIKKEHELFGRMTDQFSRFRTGLQNVDFDKVFTEKGRKLYEYFDKKCQDTFENYKNLPELFDLSNRDVDFRHHQFINLNPIEKFIHFKQEELI